MAKSAFSTHPRVDIPELHRDLVDFCKKGKNKRERPFTHNTRIQVLDDETIIIRLYGTDIVEVHKDKVILNSGGWRTVTTKGRMNMILYTIGLGVCSIKGIWHVDFGDRFGGYIGEKTPFFDRIVLPDAFHQTKEATKELKRIQATQKLIDKYCEGLKRALRAYKIPDPSGGDCWYCSMRTTEGKSLGDATSSHDHIMSHLKEKYFVPSLIFNAITYEGKAPMRWAMDYAWYRDGERTGPIPKAYVDNMARQVRRYIKRRLGLAA